MSRASHIHGCRGRAFTLIEMLVVIAIIGILAALIMPSVTAARDQARLSSCMNNLRQAGLAVTIYASDTGYYPFSYATNEWRDLLSVRYLSDKAMREKVFVCPSSRIQVRTTKATYAANCFVLISQNQISYGLTRDGSIPRSSEVIMAADCNQAQATGNTDAHLWAVRDSENKQCMWSTSPTPATYADKPIQPGTDVDFPDAGAGGGGMIRYRHIGNRAAFVFVDGHTEAIEKDKVLNKNVHSYY